MKPFKACIFAQKTMLILLPMLFMLVQPIGALANQSLLWRDLFSVSFPTEETGWVCGRRGLIAISTDSGETWSRQRSGTSYTLASITFVDSKSGWAVGDAGTILHTQDGGASWVTQKSPVDYYLMGVHFADAKRGWICTELTTILTTTDGGKTWEIQFQDPNEDLAFAAISFCDDQNGWAGGEYGFIYHTADGGKTWEKQAGFVDISWETELLVTGNYIFDLQAVDPQTAWAVGLGKYIAKTTDGGKTWQEIKLDMIPEVHLFSVWANRGGDVLIGGKGVLIASDDHGITFKSPTVDPPVTYGWIGDISQRGNNGLVAVGIKSWIYRLSEIPFGNWKLAGYQK